MQYDDEATTRVNKMRASTERKELCTTKIMTNAELKRKKKADNGQVKINNAINIRCNTGQEARKMKTRLKKER